MQKFTLSPDAAVMTSNGYIKAKDIRQFDEIVLTNGELRKPQLLKEVNTPTVSYYLKSRKNIPLVLPESGFILGKRKTYYPESVYYNVNLLEESNAIECIDSVNKVTDTDLGINVEFIEILGLVLQHSELQIDEDLNNVLEIKLLERHLTNDHIMEILRKFNFIILGNTGYLYDQKLIEKFEYYKLLPNELLSLSKELQLQLLLSLISYVNPISRDGYDTLRISTTQWELALGLTRIIYNVTNSVPFLDHRTSNTTNGSYIITLKLYKDNPIKYAADDFYSTTDLQTYGITDSIYKKTNSKHSQMIEFIINENSPIIVDNYIMRSEYN